MALSNRGLRVRRESGVERMDRGGSGTILCTRPRSAWGAIDRCAADSTRRRVLLAVQSPEQSLMDAPLV